MEHAFKLQKSLCSVYDENFDFLIGGYVDQKVRIFNERGMNLYYEMDIYPATYTSVYIAQHLEVILFGTS
jgi:hypothetical protein